MSSITSRRSIVINMLCLALLVLSGCSGTGATQDYDPAAIPQMAAYRTFALLPHPESEDPRLDNPLLQERISSAIQSHLTSAGYTLQAEAADFKVGYHLGLEKKLDVETMDTYYGYGHGPRRLGLAAGAVHSDVRVTEYEVGTLIIDIADAGDNRLVWRGTTQGEVHHQRTPEERTRAIREAVGRVLGQFPPGSQIDR